MDRGFRFFPEGASTIAGSVDAVTFFLLGVSVFFVILIGGLIVYFSIRFRRSRHTKGHRPNMSFKLDILWCGVPLLLTLAMFALGADVFFQSQTPPSDASEIYVVAKQWMWKIEHPGGRREINELHVPVGRPVRLRLISEDVIHSFFVPAFRVKQDALPGRYTSLWFEATGPGQFHLFCAEYCGTNHSKMTGRVVALSPADYQRWLARRPDEQSTAERGRLAFERLRCDSCHGETDDPRRGPALAGRFGGSVRLSGGATVPFDATYVRESILRPRQELVAGFPAIMPTYQGQIDETEILGIINYLKGAEPAPPPNDRDDEQRSGGPPAAKRADAAHVPAK